MVVFFEHPLPYHSRHEINVTEFVPAWGIPSRGSAPWACPQHCPDLAGAVGEGGIRWGSILHAWLHYIHGIWS